MSDQFKELTAPNGKIPHPGQGTLEPEVEAPVSVSPAAMVEQPAPAQPAPLPARKVPPPPPPPPPPSDEDDDGDDEEKGMLRMSFMEHLEELR